MSNEVFLSKINKFDKILYKTLASNDYKWATDKSSHQYGILIPKELAGFFPTVDYDQKIYTEEVTTIWIENEFSKEYRSNWKFYASKNEWRITGIPKDPFVDIAPGSILLIGRDNSNVFYCTVIDSSDKESLENILDVLEVREAPRWGIISKYDGALVEDDSFLDSELDVEKGISSLPHFFLP